MTQQPPCKVIKLAQQAQLDIDTLSTTMRHLRIALRKCETCPDQDCPIILELSSAIFSAIATLTEEWNL